MQPDQSKSLRALKSTELALRTDENLWARVVLRFTLEMTVVLSTKFPESLTESEWPAVASFENDESNILPILENRLFAIELFA